jgi:anti-anti-sigma regulatory factor
MGVESSTLASWCSQPLALPERSEFPNHLISKDQAKGIASDRLALSMHSVEPTMLKVTTHVREEGTTLVLEGRLCGACIAEAERGWHDALSHAGNLKILIDVAGVTFVDSAGELLLMNMLQRGAAIQVGGVLMRHLVDELRQRVEGTGGNALSRRTPRPHRSPGVF